MAGLIITGPTNHGSFPYNSAYLIDTCGAGLLCHKMNSDTQGPYQPCLDGCDGHNGIFYRNIALCCLICTDCYEGSNRERYERLAEKMENITNIQHRIVCVPAYIESTRPRFWTIPNSYRIVANSASRSEFPEPPGSFIERIDEACNVHRLVELGDGDKSTCIKLLPPRRAGPVKVAWVATGVSCETLRRPFPNNSPDFTLSP